MSKHKAPNPSADSTTTPSISTPSPDDSAPASNLPTATSSAGPTATSPSGNTNVDAVSPAAPTTAPASPRDSASAPESQPSPLELDLLRHGRLTGRDRTNDLQRLNLEHGAEVVAATIAKLIKGGVLDAGQVLTPKGQQALTRFGG